MQLLRQSQHRNRCPKCNCYGRDSRQIDALNALLTAITAGTLLQQTLKLCRHTPCSAPKPSESRITYSACASFPTSWPPSLQKAALPTRHAQAFPRVGHQASLDGGDTADHHANIASVGHPTLCKDGVLRVSQP
jgi:hypothetical protein